MRIFFNSSVGRRRILIFFLFFIFFPLASFSAQVSEKVEKVGDQICAECHDEVAAKFMQNIQRIENPLSVFRGILFCLFI